jgi:hypothetical protein
MHLDLEIAERLSLKKLEVACTSISASNCSSDELIHSHPLHVSANTNRE